MAKRKDEFIIKILSHEVTVLQDFDQDTLRSWGYMNHSNDKMRIAGDIDGARRARVLLHQVFDYINAALEIGFDEMGVRAISAGLWSVFVENGIVANKLMSLVGGDAVFTAEPMEDEIRVLSVDYGVRVIRGGPNDIRSYGHLRYDNGIITLAVEDMSYNNRVSTFIHELLHVILVDLGHDITEPQIVAFEHGFFSFLVDNNFDLSEFDWWIKLDEEYD